MYILNFINMTAEERKIFFILVGIFLIGLVVYGIYYYFKHYNKG